MKKSVINFLSITLLFFAISNKIIAQEKYQTPQNLIENTYKLMSFTKNALPNWDDIKDLFTKNAIVVLRTSPTEMKMVNRDEFVGLWLKDIEQMKLDQTGITEEKLIDKYEIMGDIATCYVVYKVFIPGINMQPQYGIDCFHLFKDKNRWYIISIVNEAIRPGIKLPDIIKDEFSKYLQKQKN